MKIDKTSIKAAIRENMTLIGGARREASDLFRRGRALRRSGALEEGWRLHHEAFMARPDKPRAGRDLTLAAAFLNNTKYSSCEPRCSTTPDASSITYWLRPCFPAGAAPTYDTIIAWLKGDVTRHELMPAPETLQKAA